MDIEGTCVLPLVSGRFNLWFGAAEVIEVIGVTIFIDDSSELSPS